MKRFGLCSDHAGFALKEEVKKILTDQGIEYQDFGTYSEERADYPDLHTNWERLLIVAS